MQLADIFDTLVTEIRACVPELGSEVITHQSSMVDLGVNSMERAEIILATLDTLNLNLPLTAIHGPRNIGDLAELIYQRKSEC
jgi:polyketide biosynthesis acyl carrier protein